MPRTAIQLPDQIKAAAAAISKCRVPFYESVDNPCGGPHLGNSGRLNGISTFSEHDVLFWFCRAGLPTVLEHIDQVLMEELKEKQYWEDILTFFLANPAAREARCANFHPESEAGKRFIIMEAEAVESDEDERTTVTRKEASDSHATAQALIMELSEAKGALQVAISTVQPLR